MPTALPPAVPCQNCEFVCVQRQAPSTALSVPPNQASMSKWLLTNVFSPALSIAARSKLIAWHFVRAVAKLRSLGQNQYFLPPKSN